MIIVKVNSRLMMNNANIALTFYITAELYYHHFENPTYGILL